MFILLLPLFSTMFHVPGPAGGDLVAAGSEIGSRKGNCAGGPTGGAEVIRKVRKTPWL
jgi:hypothetical protein